MSSLTFQLTGEVNVEVTITELGDGTLKFDIHVLDDTGSIGDLRGLFFDLADDSLTYGMSVQGDDITDEAYKIDGVTKTDGSNNLNGSVINEYGKFDIGLEFGSQGISTDDIQETSFVLSHDTEWLTLADLELQDVGIRLMSVGEVDGSRNGSLKLGGEVPEAEAVVEAYDDAMTVMESEGAGDVDLLDAGTLSVLDNDTTDNVSYTGSVEAVNGDTTQVGQMVVGSNGGLLMIRADGTVDFDANGEFDAMLDGETTMTSFTYEIEDGKTASVTVTVLGEGLVRIANDDVMTVSESETFGDADVLDSGEASVLANDTQNGGDYTDVVGSVNGQLGNVNSFVAGSNGGLLKVNADGSVDFDANGEFEALADGESAQTTFTYTLISGEEATVTVNVNGETDYAAQDDVLTVMESETSGDLETLDDGSTSVLANDTQDGAAYGGQVEGANAGVQVAGSNGGYATIYADGTIDFDAMDEFDYLADGESATTTFSYEIAGGETANVTVNVLGEDDPTTGGGEVVNLAIMLSAAQTMYATAQGTVIGVPTYPDVNGDGAGNQLMDMAYLMLNDFMADAFDDAAAAGVTLNVSLIAFDGTGGGEGVDYWSVNNAAEWAGQLDAKVSADDSSDYGGGFSNANAWFDTVSTPTSTNAVFVIGDGFTTGEWLTSRADLIADHNVEIDAYFPDLDVGSAAGVNALNLMDTDGVADQVFTDDAGLAGSIGSTSALDILDLNSLIA